MQYILKGLLGVNNHICYEKGLRSSHRLNIPVRSLTIELKKVSKSRICYVSIKTQWLIVRSNSKFVWDHILTGSFTFVSKKK